MAFRSPGPAYRGAVWLLLTALAACGRSAPAPRQRPVLLVGLDAADWRTLDPLIAAGRLPTLARLRSAGRTGTLIAQPPLVSPILWTTIATGRPPEEHGVLDFMQDLPDGGQAPVGASSRRVPALWNLFSDAGRGVAVIGWWATWPAETVRGSIVSDRVAPQLLRHDASGIDARAIAPAAARERLASLLVRPQDVSDAELRARVPASDAELTRARESLAQSGRFYDDPLAHLAAVVAGTRSYTAVAEKILREDRPDFLGVYFEAIDTVSHRFTRDARGTAAIAAACEDVDGALRRLAAAAPADTWILVVSDHGFASAGAGVAADPADLAGPATAWHRPYGIVGAIEARSLIDDRPGAGTRVPDVTPLDVAPTLLHAAGLSVGDRMPGRVVVELLPPEAAPRAVTRARLPEGGPPALDAAAANDPDMVARLRALGYVGAGPATSLARQNLAEILFRRGRFEAAERELRAVVESQPGNLSAWLWLARAAAEQGKAAEALRAYRAALPLPGAAADALVPAVELALSVGGPAAAHALFDAVPVSERATAAVLAARSLVARAGGSAREADRLLRAALAQDPLCFDALVRLFEATPREAVAPLLPYFERAVAAAPDSPRHLALQGTALFAAGRLEDAEASLRRALELAPDGDAVRVQLARVQIQRKQLEAALATLALGRPSSESETLRGAAFTLLERWQDAAAAYEGALRLAPAATPELLNGLAWAELQRGRRAESRRLLDRSLGLRPDQPAIRALRQKLESAS